MAETQSSADLPALTEAPRAGVVHIRHRHTDRFTVVGNHLAQHPTLSAVAIGLAVHIQSLPDGASVTVKALTSRFREGELTIRRALNELEAAGYLERRRVALGGGRIATRTVSYDKPGCTPAAAPPAPAPRPRAPRRTAVLPALPPPLQPAADLLAGLRTHDPRLLLSELDVHRLAPGVGQWLARGAAPDQIVRTLTASLPADPIRWPARLLEHRLTALLPPPLPPASVPRPLLAPLESCTGCERAIRTHTPGALCADCRAADVEAA